MPDRSLSEIAEKMRDIDYTMLSTRAANDSIAARPMSTNREVAYDGDSYYFTWAGSNMVAEIQRDPNVGLSFQGKAGIFGMRPFFVAVEGRAEIIRDKARFAEHWTRDLDRWFEQGPDTPGLAMIRVQAERVHYWDGDDEGEVVLARAPAYSAAGR